MIPEIKGRKYIWQYLSNKLSKHNQIIVQKTIDLENITCLSEYITVSNKSVHFIHKSTIFEFDERKKYK